MRSTTLQWDLGTVKAAMNARPVSWPGMGSLISWNSVGTPSSVTTCASMIEPVSAVSSASFLRRSGRSANGAGMSGTRPM
ncbi:hypothetical protein [Actinophytocola oryzae]|nr:hypothetical protein [Actinophytocola oryzae]